MMLSAPKRLVFHIGLHKTGTSAIQYYFHNNSAKLAEKGIEYLTEGRAPKWPLGHHQLAFALADRIYDGEAVIDAFRTAVLQSDSNLIVVSSENLSRLNSNQIQKARELCDRPTIVVFYYRRQSDIVQGLYGTDILHYGEQRSPEQYFQNYSNPLDFYQLATRWAEVFGKDNVFARAYCRDNFHRRNIVEDFAKRFCNHIIDDDDLTFRHSHNEALPWYHIKLLLRLREANIPNDIFTECRKVLQRLRSKNTAKETLRLIRPSLLREIDLSFAGSNRMFINEFCPDQPPLVPHSGEGDDAWIETVNTPGVDIVHFIESLADK